MFDPGRIRNVLLPALIAVVCVLAVGSRLLWSANPNFMLLEEQGITFDKVPLGAICHSNPFAGLEQGTTNVSDDRVESPFYSIPTKVLFGSVNPLTVHRAVSWICYFIFLVLLVGIGYQLGLHFSIAMLLTAYLGLSEQVIGPIYEAKLSITSILTLLISISAFLFFEKQMRTDGILGKVLVSVLFPLSLVLHYMSYAVSRPLGIAMVLGALLIVLSDPRVKFSKAVLPCLFLLGTMGSAGILRFMHPQLEWDLGIFSGRGESVVGAQGVTRGALSILRERWTELPIVLEWPRHNVFRTEGEGTGGWLEVLLLIGLTSVAGLIVVGRRVISVTATRIRRLGQYANPIAFLLVIIIANIVAVLCSITFVRGHRLFGFYIATALLGALLLQVIFTNSSRRIRVMLIFTLLLLTLWTVPTRLEYIVAWKADRPSDQFWHTVTLLQEAEDGYRAGHPEASTSPRNLRSTLHICDTSARPAWLPIWNGALYVSGVGCRLGIWDTRVNCSCGKETISTQSDLCLVRDSADMQVTIFRASVRGSKDAT